MIKTINQYFTDIYYNLHPIQKKPISHQSVRILQMVQKMQYVTIRDVSDHLLISHNTASEHVKKLVDSGWLYKERAQEDQRKVYLHLTETGFAILKNNTELDENRLEDALNKLSVSEREMVVRALRLLSEVSK